MTDVSAAPSTAIDAGLIRPIAELGRGGMATAYLVAMQEAGFDKLMVVKRLRPALSEEADFVKMFLQEARLSARLSHPNIVKTTEVGVDSKLPFIVMEYLEGQAFEAVAKRCLNGTIDKGTFLKISLHVIRHVLLALHCAHELKDVDGSPLNVVHRDVSPHNVMITYDGTVKLLDFGLARMKSMGAEATKTGVTIGTPEFMPPEQALGRRDAVDARSDVWGLGATLFTAITGQFVHDASTLHEQLRASATQRARPIRALAPLLPMPIAAVIDRALELEQTDRWPSAREMQRALRRARQNVEPEAFVDSLTVQADAANVQGAFTARGNLVSPPQPSSDRTLAMPPASSDHPTISRRSGPHSTSTPAMSQRVSAVPETTPDAPRVTNPPETQPATGPMIAGGVPVTMVPSTLPAGGAEVPASVHLATSATHPVPSHPPPSTARLQFGGPTMPMHPDPNASPMHGYGPPPAAATPRPSSNMAPMQRPMGNPGPTVFPLAAPTPRPNVADPPRGQSKALVLAGIALFVIAVLVGAFVASRGILPGIHR